MSDTIKAKFKVGQKVKCIDKGQKGAGWKLNAVYTIKRVDLWQIDNIYWFEEERNGVFESSLKSFKDINNDNIEVN